ncbi:MAG: hypothetical protein JW902_11420 [Syntrophaceae bacterium]|nr:hypothetical protein [Syntrophaceae bacterium]
MSPLPFQARAFCFLERMDQDNIFFEERGHKMKKKNKALKETFRRAASMMIFDPIDFFGDILCWGCKNAEHPDGGCKAFPGRALPDDILSGDFEHTKRHPEQDNDILFEPIEE